MSIVRTLLRTLAIRLAVSQSPKMLHVPGMDVMLGRETSCGLQEKRLNFSEGQSFALPSNMRQAFPNVQVEETEYQVSMAWLLLCDTVFYYCTTYNPTTYSALLYGLLPLISLVIILFRNAHKPANTKEKLIK